MSRTSHGLCAILIAAVLLTPQISHAATASLAWSDCRPFGQSLATFACNTNSGSHTLVASFTAPAAVSQFVATEVEIQFRYDGPVHPAWWQLRNQMGQTNQCRNGSISAGADFAANGLTHCLDPYGGPVAGGIATYQLISTGAYSPFIGARLVAVLAIPSGRALTEGAHYYGTRVVIDHAKTVNSCGGCEQRAMMWLNTLKVFQEAGAPGGDITLPQERPTSGSSGAGTLDEEPRIVGWQCPGAGEFSCTTTPGSCQFFADFTSCATSGGRPTWGAIKSLYR